MKLHRFYTTAELDHDFWLDDPALLHQWLKVLRFIEGQQLILFDGLRQERLYEVTKIGNAAVRLKLVTELVRQLPSREVYLFFSQLKNDKTDWVLQKCTEIGVSHFVPVISGRTEKTGFSIERAEKIVIEASEQCGRSDIPRLREPVALETALKEFGGKIKLFYAEQSDETPHSHSADTKSLNNTGVFVGPEGGWTDDEKRLLAADCQKLNLSQFTLRAETACVVAAAKLLQ